MRSSTKTAFVLGAALAVGSIEACSDSGTSQTSGYACTPGQQVNCGCPGGDQGTQICLADGSGYGTCQCGDGGAGGATGGNGGTGGDGGSGATGGSTGGTNPGGSSPGGGGTGGTASGGSNPGGGGNPGGGNPGGGGAGGGQLQCAGDPFPPNLPDLGSCSGIGTPCDSGGGAGSGTCINDLCFENCQGNNCPSPYQCVIFNGFNVCTTLNSCGSRCNIPKAALCEQPAICITIGGDSYGMCLPVCVGASCPYDSGAYEMDCVFDTGNDQYCGFVCDNVSCPSEYDCVTVGNVDRCEPQQ